MTFEIVVSCKKAIIYLKNALYVFLVYRRTSLAVKTENLKPSITRESLRFSLYEDAKNVWQNLPHILSRSNLKHSASHSS